MKKLIVIFTAFISALILTPAVMANDDSHGDGKLDPKEIIFEHLGDGYGWEVPFNHHKRIPLPVIVFGSDGLFSLRHILPAVKNISTAIRLSSLRERIVILKARLLKLSMVKKCAHSIFR